METCICQRENVPDPADVDWKQYGRGYPKVVTEIVFSVFCTYEDHAMRAVRKEKRVIRFLDNGTVEDVQ